MVMYVEAIGGGWSGDTCSSDDGGLAEGKHACTAQLLLYWISYFTQSGHKINLLQLAQERWVWSHFHQNNTTQRKFVKRESVSADWLQLRIFHEIENHHNFIWLWLICVLLPVFTPVDWLIGFTCTCVLKPSPAPCQIVLVTLVYKLSHVTRLF